MKKQLVKLITLFCILALCLSGVSCKKSDKEIKADHEEGLIQSTEASTTKTTEGTTEISDELTRVNSSLLTYQYNPIRDTVPYEPVQVTPSVQNTPVKSDFSNVYNMDQFVGFTDNQLDMMLENGFVVLGPNADYPYLKMHSINEMDEYTNRPQFISTDSVLHMFRVYYDESMKALESLVYYPRIKELTLSMYDKSYAYYQEADETTKGDLLKTTAYYGVAAKLLCGEDAITTSSELDEIIDVELSRIKRASGIEESLIFGIDVDYSQYVIRGHYTLSEDLGRFFQGMMWYGQTGFQLSRGLGDEETVDMDQVIPSLMITLMTFEDGGIEGWTDIYDMTNLYSGFADDILVIDLQELLVKIYGKVPEMKELRDSQFEGAIAEGIKELRNPAIVPEVTYNDDIDMPAGKQFRFMGQRYTLDADILQSLMEPVFRPVPTEMDVLTAMGHPVAEEILYDYYPTNQLWPDYDTELEKAKDLVANYNGWMDNIYHGILWTIQSAATSFENQKGYPYFMTTDAWSLKNLSAALGCLAELKHDNILYSKQPVAEMGGDWNQPYNYVEPNVEVYTKLLWLAKYTKANLLSGGVAGEEITYPLDRMIEVLEALESVSVKELQGEEITLDEMGAIGVIGGLTDMLYYNYQYYLQQNGVDIDETISSALVADVATIVPSKYLEVATGLPYEIYVLCEVNGRIFIAKGAVYSYYEFVSGERLTDEKWQELIGVTTEDSGNGYENVVIKPSQVDHLEMMPWMKEYISEEENHVQENYAEIKW